MSSISVKTAPAVAPFDGSVSLEVITTIRAGAFGGFLFDFTAGGDISYYQTLKFAIDKSAMTDMANMNIEMENPGQVKFAVQLANYTPTMSWQLGDLRDTA